LTPIFLQAV